MTTTTTTESEGTMTEATTTEPTIEHTLRLGDVAELLGVCKETARLWVKHKGLPAVKPGRHLLFSKPQVITWFGQQSVLRTKAQP